MGSSFIACLLGGSKVNPLPPHYYCPICKRVEFVLNEKCGIDLSEKKCSCGRYYQKDGFGISEVNMYPINNSNEINVSSNGTECVKNCLQEYFKDYGLVRELNVIYNEEMQFEISDGFKVTRFALFSKDIVKKYPGGIIDIQVEEYRNLQSECSVLMIVEGVNEQMSSRDFDNREFTTQQINAFYVYAVENGRFKRDYKEINLDKVLLNLQTPKFNELLSVYGFLYGTGAWENNAEFLYDKGIKLDELISCREDVYAYLYDKLNGKCCENPSGQVYEIKEDVRRGRYSRKGMPEEIESLLLECDVPEWYVESMKKISYLFPKTFLIVLLKRELCKFVMMNERH